MHFNPHYILRQRNFVVLAYLFQVQTGTQSNKKYPTTIPRELQHIFVILKNNEFHCRGCH
jgi:hypothetical protein